MNKAKGGKIDLSQIIRNKKTGVLSMKKARGGKVMKKARGGEARDGVSNSDSIDLETMPSGAKQYVRGGDRFDKGQMLGNYQQDEIDQMPSDNFKNFDKHSGNFDKLQKARMDNIDKWNEETDTVKKAKGGMVRGAGIATKGRGKGTMY